VTEVVGLLAVVLVPAIGLVASWNLLDRLAG
jgi:hypothetical protein